MQEADNVFFEEYKRLDRICADMYSCDNGVREYIAQMELNDAKGRFLVPSWSEDLRALKHIRWVRNQLAHSPAAYSISERADLDYVLVFHARILDGQDPLTLLRKKEYARSGKTIRPREAPRPVEQPPKESQNTSREKLSGCWLLPIFIAFCIFLAILFFSRYY